MITLKTLPPDCVFQLDRSWLAPDGSRWIAMSQGQGAVYVRVATIIEPTPGPWSLCTHLQSLEKDKNCPCGYRGGIHGPNGDYIICEMGSTVIKGEEGLEASRYPRPIELANARLIAFSPDLLRELRHLVKSLEKGVNNISLDGARTVLQQVLFIG